jgi:hypothetical protein
MNIGWKPLEVHNSFSISITFAVMTTTNIGRFTCYWTTYENSGNKTFFLQNLGHHNYMYQLVD